MGTTLPGGFAEHSIALAEKCYSIGDLPAFEVVLAEPVACVIHGIELGRVKTGADVLILGAGPAGQVLSQVVGLAGASRVVVAGPTRAKLDVAKLQGASELVEIPRDRLDAARDRLTELARIQGLDGAPLIGPPVMGGVQGVGRPAGSVLGGGKPTQAVGTPGVVFVPPVFDNDPGFGERCELGDVQQFVSGLVR